MSILDVTGLLLAGVLIGVVLVLAVSEALEARDERYLAEALQPRETVATEFSAEDMQKLSESLDSLDKEK